MADTRVPTWETIATDGFETAWVQLADRRLTARGRAFGARPEPYWVAYELDTDEEWVTRRLHVVTETAAATRELDLRNEGAVWTVNGARLSDVDGALDCDLGYCPLTNTMPVLRHDLLTSPGTHELLMAWVSVPDLTVSANRQTYTHLNREDGGARIRYESGSFRSDVLFDSDGLVVDYPQLATRRRDP